MENEENGQFDTSQSSENQILEDSVINDSPIDLTEQIDSDDTEMLPPEEENAAREINPGTIFGAIFIAVIIVIMIVMLASGGKKKKKQMKKLLIKLEVNMK